MISQKQEIYYQVLIIDNYARKHDVSFKEAYKFLKSTGAFEFLVKAYPAEHLLSIDEVISDVEAMSKKGMQKGLKKGLMGE